MLFVPTAWAAKLSELGLALAMAPSPVPTRLADCGLPGAVSLTARLAVRDPLAAGVNVTLTVQLPAGGRELPQLLL